MAKWKGVALCVIVVSPAAHNTSHSRAPSCKQTDSGVTHRCFSRKYMLSAVYIKPPLWLISDVFFLKQKTKRKRTGKCLNLTKKQPFLYFLCPYFSKFALTLQCISHFICSVNEVNYFCIYSLQGKWAFLSFQVSYNPLILWFHIWSHRLRHLNLSAASSLICQMPRFTLCFTGQGRISGNILFRYPIWRWRLVLYSVARRLCLDAC